MSTRRIKIYRKNCPFLILWAKAIFWNFSVKIENSKENKKNQMSPKAQSCKISQICKTLNYKYRFRTFCNIPINVTKTYKSESSQSPTALNRTNCNFLWETDPKTVDLVLFRMSGYQQKSFSQTDSKRSKPIKKLGRFSHLTGDQSKTYQLSFVAKS